MVNNNKPMVDLPFFELCNQAPTASSALSATATSEEGTNRFIYYISGSSFYRYDTIADTWQVLATPVIAPLTCLSLRYSSKRGYHGRVISATSNTVTIPGLRGPTLDGTTLNIQSGTGQGQSRVLTYTSETVHDAGVITATSTASLADSTKKWRINQFAGYIVGITFGTDTTQYKKILYNDATTLYIYDANLQPHDPWNNQPFVAASPYALPVVTAGAQAHYQIMSSTFSVPAWDVTPDYTSFFNVATGGLYLISSAAASPYFTLQYYDVIHDCWQTKTAPQMLLGSALGVDASIERVNRTGTVSAGNVGTITATTRTLTDAGQTLEVGRYNNYELRITSGTGIGQVRRIVNNTATTFTVQKNWDTVPDTTSIYEVWSDSDKTYLAAGNVAALLAYSPEKDTWMQGHSFDEGVVNNGVAIMKGWVPVAINTGNRIALGVQAINPVPTAGGTGYSIGDVLTCAVGGTGAQVTVSSINPGGVVTGLVLSHSGTGTGYGVGTGKAITGGTGTGCTIEVTTVGATALITTSTAHWFALGQSVTFAGMTEAAWNAAHTIIGVNSTTSFSVVITATANMIGLGAQTVTTLSDYSKNWVVNEHVGRLVHLMTAGTAPSSQIRWVISNTSNTLTVASWTAGQNGTSKYVIYDSKIFGAEDQYKQTNAGSFGMASGGSTTTLVDSSKNWIPDQWKNYLFKVEAGTGYGSGRISVISNTNNTLTYSAQSFTPDATTKYEIADTWGLMSAGGTLTPVTEATSKNWTVNQFAGKRFKITGGTGPAQESAVLSNTATAITVSVALTATDATSVYSVISVPARGAGIELIWMWGCTDLKKKGRFMFCPRGGGSNTADIFDITTGRWTFGYFYSPQSELFNTGSSYAYDGADTILMSRSVSGTPIRIMSYNINTNKCVGVATTTFNQVTATIGNTMEIVDSPDGTLSYLYCLQNTGTLLARSLMF